MINTIGRFFSNKKNYKELATNVKTMSSTCQVFVSFFLKAHPSDFRSRLYILRHKQAVGFFSIDLQEKN